jgi:asparagine synthase (glutamine-hydrolysing)
MHMHALLAVEEQRKHYSINLNGFLGDAILGGSYLFDKRWSLAEKVNQRGRRYINSGIRTTNNFFQNRIPFYSNALMDFTCSIPETLRTHSYIYNRMLLATYPKFYRKIPWQRVGVPISYPRTLIFASQKARGALRRLRKAAARFGIRLESTHEYADYPEWIRQPPGRPLFERVLLSPSALYGEFISPLPVRRAWDEHMRGIDRSEQLCRALTFELWLQQVYEQKYRQETDESALPN